MPIAKVNGVSLNYLQLDDVEPRAGREDLIMIHGLATNMAFWYFNYGVPLSRRFRVTLYDLRGHGRSEMTRDGYTPHMMAADLRALMDHLGIERAHFLSHSFGGVVALRFACEYPQRVASLILADSHFSAGRKMQARDEWGFGRRVQPILDRHQVDLDTADPYFGPRLLTRVAEWQLQGKEVPPELAELVSPLLGKTGKRTSAAWLELMNTTSAYAEMTSPDGLSLDSLRELTFPIIAMYGDNSPARLSGAELLELWPHAVFRRVRDAGHFFPTVRPAEVLSNCLRFWDGEFTDEPPRYRAGEVERNWFRSDRVFKSGGAWYFTTRDVDRHGPYATEAEAEERLAEFMSGILA
ncbi:MAG TPA: alpha/beta fold hydrolase [Rubrivivax sp.]|jgi:pimeloyl-ACP methyl ester carboxylesterase|nr:alpha/beta fold hydrolase [Rubrivivax sp.]